MTVRPLGVLLVDDSPEDRRQIQQTLGDVSFAIQLAVLEDATEALDCLRGEGHFHGVQPPDVVLLDLELAEGDGKDLLANLKSDERTAGIPVIALSEHESDATRASELGVHGFALKPLAADDFLRFVSFDANVS